MEQKDVTVGAVMTAPRYEAVAARNAIELAMQKLRIPLGISGGVFYGQCMQTMLEGLIKNGCDFAITVDSDSMFIPAHVQRLMDIAATYPQYHALAALQPMRGKGRVLGSLDKQTDVESNGKPIKVNTAHFGLTVLRLDRLQLVPKPWFWSQPDSEGSWGDGRTDEDIWFWKAWTKAGNDIYLDPGCRLGHLEEMVSVHDERGQLVHLYPEDWKSKSGSTVD